MNKRKIWLTGAAVALVAAGSPAVAAELSNAHGQSCEHGGTWHFVNNQTGGTQTPGTLTAKFSSGEVWVVQSYKVLKSVQHFSVSTDAGATLVSASTGSLPGRLVLSDFTCDDVKKD